MGCVASRPSDKGKEAKEEDAGAAVPPQLPPVPAAPGAAAAAGSDLDEMPDLLPKVVPTVPVVGGGSDHFYALAEAAGLNKLQSVLVTKCSLYK